MTCLDKMLRIADWMVRNKKVHRRDGSSGLAYEPIDDENRENGWEDLAGDIFDKIVQLVGSECLQTVGVLRLVCTNWKESINARMTDLCIFRRSESPPTNIWRVFPNIKKLSIVCSPDKEGESEIWADICQLKKLRELDLARCRGKLRVGAEVLCKMNGLCTLWLDGPTLSWLASTKKGAGLTNVSTLVLEDCGRVGDGELAFLLSCDSLRRLVLLNAGDLPRSHLEKIGDTLQIQELALVGIGNQPDLQHLRSLRRLIIHQNKSANRELFESVGGLARLKSLSLSGCEAVESSDWEQLNQLSDLEHLRLCGGVEAGMKLGGEEPATVPSIDKLELFQCPEVDEDVVRASLTGPTDLRLIQEPDQALEEVLKTSTDKKGVQDFLKSVQEPNMPEVPVCGSFFTPEMLSHLAAKRQLDTIKLLVQYGADVDYGNPMLISTAVDGLNCSTPLHFAVHNRDKKWVRRLIDLGARTNAKCTDDLRTPLHLSVQWDDLDLVKMLLASGATLESVDEDHRTPLHYAVKWGTGAVIRELLNRGADPTIGDFNLVSPIAFAAEQGDVGVVKLLLEIGMDVNEGAKYQFPTPLHRAAKVGDLPMVKFLLSKGADVLAKTEDGLTAVMLAGKEGRREVVEHMLESIHFGPIALDISDTTGKTLLHHVSWHGWVEVVEDLIRKNAQVNKGDREGFTPLYYADMMGHLDVVCKLSRVGGVARWVGRPKLYKCPWILGCGCGPKFQ
ncbi:hypothetical protein BSKO_07049 [Bryopsis sp. KO-2023]|nr:hypothetical protein BSKO_07049 [Bryopsis sp. KO-2023]